MSRTRHIQFRMRQREISEELLSLALAYGIVRPDGKVMLNRKGLENLGKALRDLLNSVERAVPRGGLVVVREGETLITTYELDSYRRRKRPR